MAKNSNCDVNKLGTVLAMTNRLIPESPTIGTIIKGSATGYNLMPSQL